MGLTSGSTYLTDPRRLVFLLSRYKFASKMILGKRDVLEIGCGDGFGSQLLTQTVQTYTGLDIDEVFVEDAKARFLKTHQKTFVRHDILKDGSTAETFDSAVSLDVLGAHSSVIRRHLFSNICQSLAPDIIVSASIESQPCMLRGGLDINCKTGEELLELTKEFFGKCTLFSMNDEVVHTGYLRMAHYILALDSSTTQIMRVLYLVNSSAEFRMSCP